MKEYIIALFCLLTGFSASAQKIKAGVVVFGGNPAGLAAAIQSAHSGVKTVLVDNGSMDVVNLTAADKAYKIGVYAEFLKRVDSLQKKSHLNNNQNLVPTYVATVFKGWTDTIKNLTVLKRAIVTEVDKDGKGWEVELKDKREIEADVVVDVTQGNQIAKKAGVNAKQVSQGNGVYADKLYRTSLAIANYPHTYPSVLPGSYFLADNADNFLLLGGKVDANILNGQGAGTAAAYCSFFKTTTKNLDVRKTQGELLVFKSQFMKFDDVALTDSNAVSIQKIAVTGILKGKLKGDQFLFLPDSLVSCEDIRLAVKEYYSRSQIWFLDHKAETLTLEDVISLIKFTANRGNELTKEIEKAWRPLKMQGDFDLKKPITRRQLARLFDTYLKPFERGITLEGNLKN
jgi:hypothetical protein